MCLWSSGVADWMCCEEVYEAMRFLKGLKYLADFPLMSELIFHSAKDLIVDLEVKLSMSPWMSSVFPSGMKLSTTHPLGT